MKKFELNKKQLDKLEDFGMLEYEKKILEDKVEVTTTIYIHKYKRNNEKSTHYYRNRYYSGKCGTIISYDIDCEICVI